MERRIKMGKKVDFSGDALNSFKKNLLMAEEAKKKSEINEEIEAQKDKERKEDSGHKLSSSKGIKKEEERKGEQSPILQKKEAPEKTVTVGKRTNPEKRNENKLYIPKPAERETKSDTLTIRLKKSLKKEFKEKCAREEVSCNYILEQLMQIYVELDE